MEQCKKRLKICGEQKRIKPVTLFDCLPKMMLKYKVVDNYSYINVL
ncbi:hypothetical protein JQ038_05290 [Clostridium botulinum]|nr:hypothetical protein [Clostridium botulinum]MCS4472577.1 hypothetical protein [Clostridium botulinum]MCS4476760.1 hypothetical protein [Clostridium botulinum]MCS4480933.1 hypothetical protein [Clostridium botulinum]MCS4482180.1 hypothetical protein [Clostridium botulinum]